MDKVKEKPYQELGQDDESEMAAESSTFVRRDPLQDGNGPPKAESEVEVLQEKVKKQVIKEGRGYKPSKYSICFVHFRGWTKRTQHKFEDTWLKQQPIEMILGKEKKELPGLAIGVSHMKSGERALLHVGWELGYNEVGSLPFPNVPPKADLVYEVELIGFDETKEGKTHCDMTVEERIGLAGRRRMDGNAFFKEDKLEEAMQQFSMAIAYMSDNFMFQLFGKYREMAVAIKNPCHLNMAACLIKLKRYDEAIEQCTIVLAEEENNVKALFRRGKARAELGQTDAAREDFLKGQKIAPEDRAIVKELRLLAEHDKAVYKKHKEFNKGIVGPAPLLKPKPRDWLVVRKRSAEDDREGSRMVRKRSEHDFDGFDRRKGFDWYGGGGVSGESRVYDRSLMHRSESFSGPRREFPKGFRSERDRLRREGSVTSWRRICVGNKELDEVGGSRSRLEERGQGLRDVRMPARSGSEQSRVRSPPRGLRDGRSMSVSMSKSISKSKSKSPTWSKDSVGSEQSKCVEVRKSEEVRVESSSSSEMEEGELEPEPEPEPEREIPDPDSEMEVDTNQKAVAEVESEKEEGPVQVQSDVDNREIQSERRVEEDKGEDELLSKEEEVKETDKINACEAKGADHEVRGSPSYMEALAGTALGSGSDAAAEKANASTETSNEGGGERNNESPKFDVVCEDEGAQVTAEEKNVQSDAERTEENGINLEVKAMDVEGKGTDKEIAEENTMTEVVVEKPTAENLAQSFKDKGKGVAVTPTHVDDSVGNANWVEREARDLMTCKDRDTDTEGPSYRGFELFGSSPVRKQEKAVQPGADDTRNEEKLGLEPLDLTLSLPNVLLPIGAAPGSPGRATSAQSLSNTFCTNSDGFTASVSYSGSHSFYHNPSCSLTQNSLDNLEQSVKSRPIFQGIDWQSLSQNEPKNKDGPLYQTVLMNGNCSQSRPNTNTQPAQAQHSRLPEGSSKMANGYERQLSFHKHLSGGHLRNHDDVKSPSHSVGSHDIGSSYSHDRKRLNRERSSGSLYRSSSSKMEQEQLLTGGANFVETVIGRIVSEPIQSMARKFHEMTGQSLACLKDSIRAILLSADKRHQISALKNMLQGRPDMTLETLQKSHRTQLEILVALKTGVPDFLQQDMGVSSSDLAEIFMNLRCRNPACRSLVPVDECDCKVCSQKNGFCSSCMCLVCAKFDMASNTCSWVGCDVCLHWCHTNCGLRESYIRNGRSATGSQGSSEMQFHCVACDHPSEMFGFVKEVFQNFAKDWTAETLSKELEYVKRIFAASKDVRGRRLHEIAGQMVVRLTNKSDLPDVYNYIMAFLNDSDSFKLSTATLPSSAKEQSKPSNGIAGPSQEPSWLKSIYTEKVPQLDIPSSLLPSYSYDRNDKSAVDLELQTNSSAQKEPLFDELESIVRVKLAEAKMFQTRADDARREAEGLQRIALAKNEKIDEEYAGKIAKLRLADAEQSRKQRFEELQALEQAHREYFNMKMRMEAEIKDLLVKMEATKRNLAA